MPLKARVTALHQTSGHDASATPYTNQSKMPAVNASSMAADRSSAERERQVLMAGGRMRAW